MTHRTLNQALCASAAIIALAAPAVAQAQPTANLNLPAQDLGKSLRAVGQATNSNIAFDPADTSGKTAPALKGSYSARAAVERLIEGSGLKARSTGSGSIVVSTEKNALAGAPNAGSNNNPDPSLGDDAASADQGGIAEILVVGSRSQNVDIRRTEDDPQPYVVFQADEIEKSGASNLEDFLRKRLPMNTQAGSSSQPLNTEDVAATASQVNLRGLGIAQTLILIDGRRAPRLQENRIPPSFTQADINGIPISAIDRIEILPSTAGGIYGGGAVGGVINIIRKRDYRGVTGRLTHEGTFTGGGESNAIEITGGFSPNRGRTQISFAFAASKAAPLHVEDNDLWLRARRRAQRVDYDQSPPLGFTTNIAAAPRFDFPCFLETGDFFGCQIYDTNLTLKPEYGGGQLGSPFTYIPVGYAGPSSDNGAGLIANAGRYNLELADNLRGGRAPLRNGSQVRSVNVNLRHELTRSLDVFLDGTVSRNSGTAKSISVSGGKLTLLADAANNPFEQDVVITFPEGLPSSSRFETNAKSLSGGLIARLSRDWTTTVEHNWSQQRSSFVTEGPNLGDPFFSPLIEAYSEDSDYSPFRDINAYPFDYSPFVQNTSYRKSGPAVTTQSVTSLRAAGKVVSLPGGPLNLTALVERRSERAGEYRSPAGMGNDELIVPKREQSITSAYAEITAPLFAAANARLGLESLDLSASLRFDRYRTIVADPASYIDDHSGNIPEIDRSRSSVRALSYTSALAWSPGWGLRFRGSYSTGFLPPNISQLVPTTTQFLGPADPKRGGEPAGSGASSFIWTTAGNPELDPEYSKSLSAGIIWLPTFADGLRVSIDFTRIRKRGEIGDAPDLTVLEEHFPDRIIRSPLTPEDEALGFTGGVITSLDTTLLNISRSTVSAWDVQLDYVLRFGDERTVRLYGVVTRQTSFRRKIAPESLPYNSVGYADGPLTWRGNFGAELTRGSLSAGLDVQFYDRHSVKSAAFLASDPSHFNDRAVAAQGDTKIPRQIYADAFVGYRFPSLRGPLMGLKIFLGVQNLFDSRPPALATYNSLGTYSPYGDPRLRRFTLALTKDFDLR